jgi:murein L,D-transpeptidase YafK
MTATVDRGSVKYPLVVFVFAVIAGVSAWNLWPDTPLPPGTKADLVVVHKAARRLELYRGNELLKAYQVSLGRHPIGSKTQQGDGRTPQGDYRLDYRNPTSSFHKSLHISYPERADIASAQSRNVDPGGLVMVHGMRNGFGWIGRLHRAIDWTDGCVAVTNNEIDEIWDVVPDGTKILLDP